MKKITLLIVSFFFIISGLFGQENFQFHMGFGFPKSELADSDEDNWIDEGSGHAATGFNIGFKLFKPLSVEHLNFILSADIFYNDLNSDAKDEFDSNNWEYVIPKYLNIPIMLGLNYEYRMQDDFSIYAEGGLGIDLLKITNLKETYQKDDYFGKNTYSISTKMGYNIGFGVNFKEKYNISLNYYGLGSHKCKVKYENSDGDDDTYHFDNSLEIAILSLSFGIKL